MHMRITLDTLSTNMSRVSSQQSQNTARYVVRMCRSLRRLLFIPLFVSHYVCIFCIDARHQRLTVAHILHSPILANVNVQPIRLVVHGAHAVGLEDTVFFGEVLLCKSLGACVSLSSCLVFLHS